MFIIALIGLNADFLHDIISNKFTPCDLSTSDKTSYVNFFILSETFIASLEL